MVSLRDMLIVDLYDSESSFTFYVDNEYRIIDFFENWIAYISGEDNLKINRIEIIVIELIFPTRYKSDSLIHNKV